MQAGVARVEITPPGDVELAGLGYFAERTPREFREPLSATAVWMNQHDQCAVLVSVDAFLVDTEIVEEVHSRLPVDWNLSIENLWVMPTHGLGTPTLAATLGQGERDPAYASLVVRKVVTAIVMAKGSTQVVSVESTSSPVSQFLVPASSGDAVVDPTLTTIWLRTAEKQLLCCLFQIAIPPSAPNPQNVNACWAGRVGAVRTRLESMFPGMLCVFLPGCTEDLGLIDSLQPQTTPDRAELLITAELLRAASRTVSAERHEFLATSAMVELPTRTWDAAELEAARLPAQQRLRDLDETRWETELAEPMRFPVAWVDLLYAGDAWLAIRGMCRFQLAWTFAALTDERQRPVSRTVCIRSLKIGPVLIAGAPLGVHGSLSMALRHRHPTQSLAVVSYVGGACGIIRAADESQREDWWATHAAKIAGQNPYTPQAAGDLLDGLSQTIYRLLSHEK